MNKKEKLNLLIETYFEIETLKSKYKIMEELVDSLSTELGLEEIKYKDYYIQIVDNFSNKNLAWKATAFRRYDVKIRKV